MTINKKGFTLIELLVVIAIIGILSGLILVSMSGATGSAKDARIQEDMHQMISVAAIYNNTNSTYGTATTWESASNFTGVGDGLTLGNDMVAQQSTAPTVYIAPTTFCIAKTLNTGTAGTVANLWCIDSNGFTGHPTGAYTNLCTGGARLLCSN